MRPILLTGAGGWQLLVDASVLAVAQRIDWQGVPGCSTQVKMATGDTLMVAESPEKIAELVKDAKEA